MKNPIRQSLARLAAVAAKAAAAALLTAAAPLLLASCSEDKTSDEEKNYVEGVIIPADNTVECNASATNITVTFETESSYSLEVDDEAMLRITNPGIVSQAGKHSAKILVTANATGEPRNGTIYITVQGHNRTKLYGISQSAGADNEVVEWIDERLSDEYYWLDEYVQKRSTFDFSLEYDKFLSTSLLSLSSNAMDGGVQTSSTGLPTRYLYSYITREEASSAAASHTRAATPVQGWGISLASMVWTLNSAGTLYGLAVDNVYPDSPAAKAGLRRGDIISQMNGTDITGSNYADVWNTVMFDKEASAELTKIDQSTGASAKVSLSRGSYHKNPVAYSAVLDLPEHLNKEGRKIGYLVYTSFDSDYDDKLVEAVTALKTAGVTDLILDLRSNGGGSVNSSIKLASMILDRSHAGKVYADLKRNPANEYGDSRCLLDANVSVNLGLDKLWVIASDGTASASEMVIMGLRGLDVPVTTVGTRTEGKNCGMDVMERTIGSYKYTFAPITFLIFNAKGNNDYSGGIAADADLEHFASDAANGSVKQLAGLYPMPMTVWGDYEGDIALLETVMQIDGRTLFDLPASTESVLRTTPVTRGGETMRRASLEPIRRASGATLTEQERTELENAE